MISRREFEYGNNVINIAFTGEAAGNMSPAFGHDAAENEAAVFKNLGLDTEKVVRMDANGGTGLVHVNAKNRDEWLTADAFISDEPGQVLALYPADCIPLVLWSEQADKIALVHLGRLGAQAKLAATAVKEMVVAPESLHGWIGPSIRSESYDFDEDAYAEKLDSSWDEFTRTKDGVHYVDLTEYVLRDLANIGLHTNNITIEEIDTGADARYFSHHRAKSGNEPDGRNGVFVWVS